MQHVRTGLTLSLSTFFFIACATPTTKLHEELIRSAITGNDSAPEWVAGRLD